MDETRQELQCLEPRPQEVAKRAAQDMRGTTCASET